MSDLHLSALGPKGVYTSRAQMTVGRRKPVVTSSVVPSIVVTDWLDSLRTQEPLSAEEASAVTEKAADVFANQEVQGYSLAAHERLLASLTGTPISVIQECNRLIVDTLRNVQHQARLAAPVGAAKRIDHSRVLPRRPVAAWTRRGEVFAVHAAGNSPGVHAGWLEALALGYRVAVRPSRRDPLTPYRLIRALRDAGLPNRQLVLAPGDHSVARKLIESADRSLVYGGQDVVDDFRNRCDVLTQGPGRSKLVVCDDADRSDALALAVAGAVYHAGTACTATTAVLVETDPSDFASDLADALREIRPKVPWSEEARLPCMTSEEGQLVAAAAESRVDPECLWLQPRVEPVSVEDELAAVTPAVIELSSPNDARVGRELPFPCLWVAPFDRGELSVLQDSLVVSLQTEDAGLVDQVLQLPGVSNVHWGRPTSDLHPDVPHDGFLAEFLMRGKGFITGRSQ